MSEEIIVHDSGRVFIFGCDCNDWKRRHTITFDSQDAQEQGWTKCPFCKKPFKTVDLKDQVVG